ncbi:hypothetical protein LIER_34855 [Lithospermum erythrorhizon]|uniref:Uncharacterized protein n=1 Tax=Lithospermum erythrorhizon TaxID=34254 RepID=A0AAV3S203_LITER
MCSTGSEQQSHRIVVEQVLKCARKVKSLLWCWIIMQARRSDLWRSNWLMGSQHQKRRQMPNNYNICHYYKNTKFIGRKIEQIMQEPLYGRTRGDKTNPTTAATDDSLLGKQSNKQGNSHTDLPPDVDFMFPNDAGIENAINHYHEAGYKLLARRSLSPIDRSSPKLVSLRKKVKYIEIGEDKTVMDELTGHSEDYQSSFEQVCLHKSSSHGEKQPSPNGPGQSRQKRNRGRNRSYYGCPGRSPNYRGKGY